MAPICHVEMPVKMFVFILYKLCFWNLLFQQHEGAFLSILAAVKGTQAEKRLASQFITRFFKFFPKLQENAIDAMLDLCEDEDNMVSLRDRHNKFYIFNGMFSLLLCWWFLHGKSL